MRYSRTILLLLVWVLPTSGLASSKIDTIYFQHGDRLTGEVKLMENNYLRLSTEDAGTVSLEWTKVDSVKILTNMRIGLMDGRILYGKLLASGIKGSCYIWSNIGDPLLVELIHIVTLSPVKDRIINRLDGSLGSGFSYVKASDLLQLNVNVSINYRAEKNNIETFYDGIVTRDSLGNTQRHNGGATFIRFFPNNWFLISQVSAEKNTELQLDLRTNLKLGAGKGVIRSNSSHLRLAAGMQVNRETSLGNEQYNLEAAAMTEYSVFIYDDPEVSFDIKFALIPSLSAFGRIRSDLNSNLKWELFNDFFLKWSFYYSFDSRPLSETAAKSDWAITMVGLEYKL